jgi:hypothetical protein
MKPPKGVEVTETATGHYWLDQDGILWAKQKKIPDFPLEARIRSFSTFREKMGNKRICMIIDVTDGSPISREAQHFNLKEFPKVFKAIAFVSRSAYGRMLGRLYLGMHESPLPIEIFSSEADALQWIRQYL